MGNTPNVERRQLHLQLRELLPSAVAESRQVVATFLDVRGFSAFSAQGESFDSALYLRSIYSIVLSSFFDDADFFKPTGDGLLLIHVLPPDSHGVAATMSSILSRCLRLVDEFGELTDDDVMIYFPVPQCLGIGIARGSATRLVSSGVVLDYTGRCLNLAARLMDKARPAGVVFSDKHAKNLVELEVMSQFSEDHVCIRGIAEDEPIEVVVSRHVALTPADREPFPKSSVAWGRPCELSVSEVRGSTAYSFWLPQAPRSYERTGVEVSYPDVDSEGRPTDTVRTFTIVGTSEERPEGFVVSVSFEAVHQKIKSLPDTWITRVLKIEKNTLVTFTPFCKPVED
jgi:class 3 adenylate cyclase